VTVDRAGFPARDAGVQQAICEICVICGQTLFEERPQMTQISRIPFVFGSL